MLRFFYFALSFFIVLKIDAQSIIYVKQNAIGLNNGASWTHAYTSLQSALQTATPGQQIWVAAGIYKPSQTPAGYAQPNNARTRSFYVPDGVAMYGGFAGTETTLEERNWQLNPVILSGDTGIEGYDADNTYHVLTIDRATSNTRVDGFIIEKGFADGATTPNYDVGGGLYNHGDNFLTSSPTIANCWFRNNHAAFGGGAVYNAARWDGVAEPLFLQCIFTGNTSNLSGGCMRNYARARGVCQPNYLNCTMFNNFGITDSSAIISVVEFLAPNGTTATLLAQNTLFAKGSLNKGVLQYCLYESPGSFFLSFSNCIIGQAPIFADAANLDLQLASGSPAIDAGANALLPVWFSRDFNGQNRVFNDIVDIGAFELVQEVPTAPQAVCQAATVYLDNNGQASLPAVALDGGSTGVAPLQLSSNGSQMLIFNCQHLGIQTVALEVSNSANLSDTCLAQVLVLDTLPPVLLDAVDDTLIIGFDGVFTFDTAYIAQHIQAADNCGQVQIGQIWPQQVDCAQINSWVEVFFTLADGHGNTTTSSILFYVSHSGDQLPWPWQHDDIGTCQGDAFAQTCSGDESVKVWATALAGQSQTDQRHTVYQPVCGNGQLTVHVRNLSPGASAGVMWRQNLNSSVPMIGLKTQLGAYGWKEKRTAVGQPRTMLFLSPGFTLSWLRLSRQGNTFTAYGSPDGLLWSLLFSETIEMPDCALAGFFAEGHAEASVAEAVFDRISWEVFPDAIHTLPDVSPAGEIALYPNPASNYVNIHLPISQEQQALCRLVSSAGQVIIEQRYHAEEASFVQFNWQHLPAGLYYVQVLYDEKNKAYAIPLVIGGL